MIVSVMAAGSLGDVQPPAALAAGLAARGHTVRLLAPETFADLVVGRGVAFRPLAVDVRAELDSAEGRKFFAGGGNEIGFLRWMLNVAKRHVLEEAPKVRDYIAGSDLIVGAGLMDPFATIVARYQKTPCVHAYLQPILASRSFPSPALPPPAFELPGWMNKAQQSFVQQASWLIMRPVLRVVCELLDAPPPGLRPGLSRAVRAGETLLFAYSEALLPRPRDWPANVEVTGYWFLDRPKDWRPPEGLKRFIETGPPPIYVGFGSMAMEDPQATLRTVLEAIRGVGCRAVVSAGWSGMRAANLPEDMMAIEAAPHDWLFPQMAAVVHHGGAGTTGAALRAGVPSVVVPFITDQFFWARQLEKRGVAPAGVPHKRLTANALGQAIGVALGDQAMRRRAAEIGTIVRAEDGVGRAVAAIERALV